MKEIRLKYHPVNVTIYFCFGIFFFAVLIYLLINTYQKPGALIFLTILFLLGAPPTFYVIKNFIRFILGKPCIILNSEHYIDKINNIKIKWEDINSIGSSKYRHWTFLTFDLKDNALFFKQIRNPVFRLIVRVESLLTKTTFKTNTSFIRDSNEDIYRSVSSYYKNYAGLNGKNSQ